MFFNFGQPQPNLFSIFTFSQFNDKFNRQIAISDQINQMKSSKIIDVVLGSNTELSSPRLKLTDLGAECTDVTK